MGAAKQIKDHMFAAAALTRCLTALETPILGNFDIYKDEPGSTPTKIVNPVWKPASSKNDPVAYVEHQRFKRGGTSIESELEGFSPAEEPSLSYNAFCCRMRAGPQRGGGRHHVLARPNAHRGRDGAHAHIPPAARGV